MSHRNQTPQKNLRPGGGHMDTSVGAWSAGESDLSMSMGLIRLA